MSAFENIVIVKLNDKRKYPPTMTKELLPEAVEKVGSEFKPGTRDCIRGLNPIQERKLLPVMLGLQPTDGEFPLRARDFWADFSFKPTAEGVKLNVATVKNIEIVEGKEVEYESPVNVEDYIAYQMCLQSSRVAKSVEDAEAGDLPFIMIDLSEAKRIEEEAFALEEQVAIAYARLVKEPRNDDEAKAAEIKLDQLILMLKPLTEHFDFSSSMSAKKMFIFKVKETDKRGFLELVNNPNLETVALLRRSLEMGQITLEGENYFLGNVNLGPNKSAISWLSNPENSASVLQLKSRLEKNSNLSKK